MVSGWHRGEAALHHGSGSGGRQLEYSTRGQSDLVNYSNDDTGPPMATASSNPRAGFAPLLLLLVFAVACSPAAQGPGFGSAPPRVEATPEMARLERQMLDLVNRDRAQAGLSPLEWDSSLADIARAHSLDMKTAGFFSHDSPGTGTLQDRLDRAGYLALEARENLASAPTVDKAEENLLASPSHRANLESKGMTHVGVGIVQGDRFGDARMLTVTQVFAKPATKQSADEVATTVLAAVERARKQRRVRSLEPHGVLEELARHHVDEIPLDLNQATLTRIGDEVAGALEKRPGHGLKAVQIAAQVVFHADQFDVAGAPLDPKAHKRGIATAAAQDGRGSPQTKVLLLLGQ